MLKHKVRFLCVFSMALVLALTGLSSIGEAKDREVILSEGAEIGLLDPHRARSTEDMTYLNAVFDSLFQLHDEEVQPALAVSYRLVDDQTWELGLRKGVRFQNGDPFTAKDVKFSLDRLIDPATKNPLLSLYSTIDKTDIVDDHTIVITTKGPDPLLIRRIMSRVAMLPYSYIEKHGIERYLKKPIGAGPYKFVEWVRNDHLTLEAFEDYWGGAPRVDRVIIKPRPEVAARVASVETGEADIITNIPPFLIPRLKQRDDVEVQSILSRRVNFVNINTCEDAQAPLRNQKVRQALNYAVNKKLIIEKILMQSAIQRATFLNNYQFGFDPNVKPYPYDPEKAKKLLAEAGYKDGFTLDFVTPSGRYVMDREVSEAICGMLNKVGIKTDLRVLEFGNFVKGLLNKEHKGVYFVGWLGSFNDADGTFSNFFLSQAPNHIYKTPIAAQVEELTREARTEMDKDKRKQIYSRIQELILEDAPLIFLYQLKDNYAARSRVAGFKARSDQIIDFFPIRVE